MQACLIGACLLVACGGSQSEPDACFPVPAGAQVLLVSPGMETQGTTLQGQPPSDPLGQGTTLQGQPLPPGQNPQGTTLQGSSDIMTQQGTTLQGTPNIMQQQGTTLQGTPNIMQQQGTTLQGTPNIMQQQGTTLQGSSNVATQQGTTLQGTPSIMQQQGTTLQGTPNVIQQQGTTLQGTPNIMQQQGTTLQGTPSIMEQQGTTLQGQGASSIDMPNQGTSLQGSSSFMEQQGTRLQGALREGPSRAYRGLGDLNGARLALESDESNAVTVQDGQLVARGFPTTASLRGTPVAAIAPDGRRFRVEVVGVTLDGRTERHKIMVDGFPACQPDQDGMFVAGRWDARAAFVADPEVVTYSCSDGVIAKCVEWGYAPWLTGDEIHAGCTRLARADYCGDGAPWTMDGTSINVFDGLGIQAEAVTGDMAFEAAWGPAGAICVARSRYEVHDASGRSVLPRCFVTLPRCDGLDEAAALGAVLANRSRVTPIEACD